jgi:hypothetical protein
VLVGPGYGLLDSLGEVVYQDGRYLATISFVDIVDGVFLSILACFYWRKVVPLISSYYFVLDTHNMMFLVLPRIKP